MNDSWSIAMLICGALFAAGAVPIAWERAPAWRTADPATFRAEFAYTLRRMDRLQPALLLATLAATTGFAITAHGTARTLATLAAACFAAILAGSTARLVPTQRRLTNPRTGLSAADVDRLRTRWLGGHRIRTLAALAGFALLVVAAVA